MSVFTNLSTIVSIAAGAFFLGEEITVYHWIGSLLIIAGVIGTNRLGRKQPDVQAAGRSESASR
ncbi:EamA-like transporter family protein [compost metagenome]